VRVDERHLAGLLNSQSRNLFSTRKHSFVSIWGRKKGLTAPKTNPGVRVLGCAQSARLGLVVASQSCHVTTRLHDGIRIKKGRRPFRGQT